MAANTWTADRRLYLDASGKVVEADDPTRLTLLVTQGKEIPMADAIRYGLIPDPSAAQEETAKPAPSSNKLRTPARENKGSED